MMHEVVLRNDDGRRDFGGFPTVYKIIAVSAEKGGVKLENIETGEVLLGDDNQPLYIMKATELRPPSTDEARHARALASAFQNVQVTGPEGEDAKKAVTAPDEVELALMEAQAANTDSTAFDAGRTLAEMQTAHTELAHRIGNLKIRAPFRQALAASQSGASLTDAQRSAVEFIEGMEDALKRARAAQHALFDHKDDLTAGR